MRIKYQLLLVLLLVSVLPMLISAYFFYSNTVKLLTDTTEKALQEETSTKASRIEKFLDTAKGDVLFLSNSPSLNEVINAGDERVLEILEKEFLEFSKARESYYQIRYIDEKGKEIVRVDFDGSGHHGIVPEDELQDKGDRYYFTETMEKNANEVFISPLDLNKERGKIENRGSEDNPSHVPVIRYAVRVFDDDSNPRGIVIANIYTKDMLNDVKQSSFGKMTLINRNGFYLSHPNASKEWGFMLNTNENIENDYPSINKADLFREDLNSGQIDLHDKVAYYQTISVNDHFWAVLNIIPINEIVAVVRAGAVKILWSSLMLVGALIVLSLWLSSFLTKPIERMVGYSKGDEKLDPKDIQRRDEIGALAKSFERMSASIEFMSQDQNQKGKSGK